MEQLDVDQILAEDTMSSKEDEQRDGEEGAGHDGVCE
jgi:hypothetical protein